MAGESQNNSILSRLAGLLSGLGGGSSGSAVGLSIGSSSIKLVELKKTGKSWKLLHFGIVQLPEDVIVNREIINQIVVVESIQSLVNQIKLKNKSVCSSLSGTGVIIKRLSVDVPNIRELQDAVFWEAEQYLPFDISEVVMDYHMISRAKDNRTDVVLVAAKRATVESYMGCIEDSGLKPRVIDTDFFALQTLYETNYPQRPSEATALIDIGASAIKLTVVFGGVPVFTKDTALGGKNLTAEIQRHLSISYADAEALKTGGHGGGMPQEVNDLMHVMAENFAGEIKRALDFYNASSSGAPVSTILLAGGSSKIPGLQKLVEDMVGIPTQLMNPFNAISYDPAVFTPEYVASIAPIASVPIGLAIRAGEK